MQSISMVNNTVRLWAGGSVYIWMGGCLFVDVCLVCLSIRAERKEFIIAAIPLGSVVMEQLRAINYSNVIGRYNSHFIGGVTQNNDIDLNNVNSLRNTINME